jgi:type II secretory pathway pseudopilin PulG
MWSCRRSCRFNFRRRKNHQNGMAMVAVTILVLTASLSLLLVTSNARQERQRLREAELLFIGAQFTQAFESYSKPIDGAGVQFPADLKDLLLDTRSGIERRHLRRIYDDPMTGKNVWGLLRDQRGVIGVHSTSQSPPLRKAGFSSRQDFFKNAKGYNDWVFLAAAPSVAVVNSATTKNE